MLRTKIHINQATIVDVHAQRMEGFKGDNYVHLYHGFTMIDEKERAYMGVIKHKYSSGAEELAVKLLRLYKRWFAEENK